MLKLLALKGSPIVLYCTSKNSSAAYSTWQEKCHARMLTSAAEHEKQRVARCGWMRIPKPESVCRPACAGPVYHTSVRVGIRQSTGRTGVRQPADTDILLIAACPNRLRGPPKHLFSGCEIKRQGYGAYFM